MIESLDLLTEDKVFQQSWTTLSSLKTILVLNGASHIRGHKSIFIIKVELGQELLSISSSISIIATTEIMFRHFSSHIRTSRIGHANEARKEHSRMHDADRVSYCSSAEKKRPVTQEPKQPFISMCIGTFQHTAGW